MGSKFITQANKLLSNFNEKNISSIEEWKEIPLKRKSDILNTVPKQFLELRITSGSTGEPLFIYYSSEAVDAFIQRGVESIRNAGVTKKDIVLNLFAYGNYVPGSMYERVCLVEGISVLPLGAPNTYPKEKIFEVVKRLKPTVWFSVPSYALAQLNIIASIDKTLLPRVVVVAGERLLDSYIDNFKQLGVELVNNFGSTECPAIGFSDGDPKLIKTIPDGIYAESVEVDGNDELVITDLRNRSTPIIRYNTRDLIKRTKINPDGSLAEFEIIGRSDDLLKLKGLLVSKNKIVSTLSAFTQEFYVDVVIKNGMDWLNVFLPISIKSKEAEIVSELSKVYGKLDLLFLDELNVPKTSSHKSILVRDLRK